LANAGYAFAGYSSAEAGASYPSFVSRESGGTKTTTACQITNSRLVGGNQQTPYDPSNTGVLFS
jgi:hypothetical protein